LDSLRGFILVPSDKSFSNELVKVKGKVNGFAELRRETMANYYYYANGKSMR
jgi:hypothetical protein